MAKTVCFSCSLFPFLNSVNTGRGRWVGTKVCRGGPVTATVDSPWTPTRMAFSLPLSSLLMCPEPLLGTRSLTRGWEHNQRRPPSLYHRGPGLVGRRRELGECSTGCWLGSHRLPGSCESKAGVAFSLFLTKVKIKTSKPPALMYSFSYLEPCIVVPCPVLTVASYRFLKRQVRWPGIPISFRIFHSLL